VDSCDLRVALSIVDCGLEFSARRAPERTEAGYIAGQAEHQRWIAVDDRDPCHAMHQQRADLQRHRGEPVDGTGSVEP
jgi:hypothetical protein